MDVRWRPDPFAAADFFKASAYMTYAMTLNPFVAYNAGVMSAYRSQFELGECHPLNMLTPAE